MTTSTPTTIESTKVNDPRVTFYDQAYRESNTIWDSGRPQPALQEALTTHETNTTHTVLEVGCGRARPLLIINNGRARPLLMMAERGFHGLGIDSSQHAIDEATKTAQQRGLSKLVQFKQYDYRLLSQLNFKFDIVIDCAFSHILSVEQRQVYADQVTHVMNKGGRLYILSYAGKAEITSQMIKDRVLPQGWTTIQQTGTETGTGTGTGTETETETERETEKKQDEFSIPPGMTEHDLRSLYPRNKGWEVKSIETVKFVAANGATGPCLLSILTYVGKDDTTQLSTTQA